MAGKHKGLQAHIQAIQPKALCVWCTAHRLNLVVEAVVGCCPAVRNCIGILQELFNFFGSHRRHDVLVTLQKDDRYKRTLKRVSNTTRTWRSVEDGCTMLMECFGVIETALEQLMEQTDWNRLMTVQLCQLLEYLSHGCKTLNLFSAFIY